MNNSLVLVDGSAYLYRAFHALPPLTNARNEPSGAIYGVGNMLRRLLDQHQPRLAAVVFDAPGKTFRDALYPEYKANRPPMPEELRAQLGPLKELVEILGFPLLEIAGVEADDVIGTLATLAQDTNLDVLISTSDKDLAQLVNQQITLVNTMSNSILDPAGVVAKFGVSPAQIIDYLALVGDSVDNIPGVPKCGPKTAAKWLATYQDLDTLITRASEITGKVGQYLRDSLPALPLSRALATIKTDVQLGVTLDDLELQTLDFSRLKTFAQHWDFKSWLDSDQLRAASPASISADAAAGQPQIDYEIVTSEQQLLGWVERLKQAEYFAFDTETTSLNYMQAEIVGVSFAIVAGAAAYVPVAHDYPGAPPQLARDRVLDALKDLLEDPKVNKIGQNLKYDRHVLANYGINLNGIEHDTMLQSYVWDSTATRHDMDSLAKHYLNCTTVHFEDIAGKGAKQLTFNQIEIAPAAHYAAEDADITLQLHQRLWPQLQTESELARLYQEIEVPLIPILGDMERTGVMIDSERLRNFSKELTKRLVETEQRAYAQAGGVFNLGSPKQIQEILYQRLELPILKKTPKGQPSTAEDVLQDLAHDYPLPAIILEYRGLAKLKSTYVDKLPEMVNIETGRVHSSFHQAVASTGRLSSSDPNLQNIPVRTEDGRKIRQAFVAPPGRRILAADYSQIELRIMAHLSKDDGLLAAFAAGADVHRATAAEVFATPLGQVSSEQRRSAKAINFGLIYGMSAFGLARQLNIGRAEAQQYVNLYFERYPGVKRYMDETRAIAHQRGYVETIFGRRLYLPEINSRNAQRRAYAERTAINAPMQGSAADIIKRAMLSVSQWLNQADRGAHLVMQVHDELVFEVKTELITTVKQEVIRCMTKAADLNVPLVVDAHDGNNWDEAH